MLVDVCPGVTMSGNREEGSRANAEVSLLQQGRVSPLLGSYANISGKQPSTGKRTEGPSTFWLRLGTNGLSAPGLSIGLMHRMVRRPKQGTLGSLCGRNAVPPGHLGRRGPSLWRTHERNVALLLLFTFGVFS